MIDITTAVIITHRLCTVVTGMRGSDSVVVSETNNTFKPFPREDIIIYLEVSARTCLPTEWGRQGR